MRRGDVLRFCLRRLAALLLILLVLSLGIFALLYLAPGGIEQTILGNKPASPATVAAIRAEHHLDDPFFVQYWYWLREAAHFDFGVSVTTGEPVTEMIEASVGVTLFLGAYAFIFAMLVGVPLGIWAALRRQTKVDSAIVGLSVVGVSAPIFVTGIALLYIFAVALEWFPAFGAGSGIGDRFYHLTLPAIALALSAMALVVKMTRAGMGEALESDYVAFARARGVPATRVVLVHGLRNALIPIVTAAGIVLGYTLTGAILAEVTFSLPGLGAMLVEAVSSKDVSVVQGVTLLFAVFIVVVNAVVDLSYGAIDPRIRAKGTAP